jgi:hypothetical protein
MNVGSTSVNQLTCFAGRSLSWMLGHSAQIGKRQGKGTAHIDRASKPCSTALICQVDQADSGAASRIGPSVTLPTDGRLHDAPASVAIAPVPSHPARRRG